MIRISSTTHTEWWWRMCTRTILRGIRYRKDTIIFRCDATGLRVVASCVLCTFSHLIVCVSKWASSKWNRIVCDSRCRSWTRRISLRLWYLGWHSTCALAGRPAIHLMANGTTIPLLLCARICPRQQSLPTVQRFSQSGIIVYMNYCHQTVLSIVSETK